MTPSVAYEFHPTGSPPVLLPDKLWREQNEKIQGWHSALADSLEIPNEFQVFRKAQKTQQTLGTQPVLSTLF